MKASPESQPESDPESKPESGPESKPESGPLLINMNMKIVDKKYTPSTPTLNKFDGKILMHCKAIMTNMMTASICKI